MSELRVRKDGNIGPYIVVNAKHTRELVDYLNGQGVAVGTNKKVAGISISVGRNKVPRESFDILNLEEDVSADKVDELLKTWQAEESASER